MIKIKFTKEGPKFSPVKPSHFTSISVRNTIVAIEFTDVEIPVSEEVQAYEDVCNKLTKIYDGMTFHNKRVKSSTRTRTSSQGVSVLDYVELQITW